MKKEQLNQSKVIFTYTSERNIPGTDAPLVFEVIINLEEKAYNIGLLTKSVPGFSLPPDLKEFYCRLTKDYKGHEASLFFIQQWANVLDLVERKLITYNISLTGEQYGPEAVGPQTPFGFTSRDFQELSLLKFDDWCCQNKYVTPRQLNGFQSHLIAAFDAENWNQISGKTMADAAEVLRRSEMQKKLTPYLYFKLMEIFLYHDLKLEQ